MVRFFSMCGALVLLALSLPAASAEDMPGSILKYFPGKWTNTGAPNGEGSVEWKLVAEGKTIAGPGMTAKGGADFGLGGWQAKEKKWVHTWFQSDGGYGRTDITKSENGSYYGTTNTVDGSGKQTSGEFQIRVIDKDRFELSVIAAGEKVTSQWQRVR